MELTLQLLIGFAKRRKKFAKKETERPPPTNEVPFVDNRGTTTKVFFPRLFLQPGPEKHINQSSFSRGKRVCVVPDGPE